MVSNVSTIRTASPNAPQAAERTDEVTFVSVEKTGPGTLAGRYLRTFWQPVLHSHELKINQARPLRILGQDLTIYRGASGQVHIVGARCPHRTAPLGLGRVEGEEIRCFYHGWRFNGDGQCTDNHQNNYATSHHTRLYSGRDRNVLVSGVLTTETYSRRKRSFALAQARP